MQSVSFIKNRIATQKFALPIYMIEGVGGGGGGVCGQSNQRLYSYTRIYFNYLIERVGGGAIVSFIKDCTATQRFALARYSLLVLCPFVAESVDKNFLSKPCQLVFFE